MYKGAKEVPETEIMSLDIQEIITYGKVLEGKVRYLRSGNGTKLGYRAYNTSSVPGYPYSEL